jgi:hypothetical protein
MLDETLSTSTSADCEKRKTRQTEATNDVIVCLAKETYIAVSGSDQEVSVLIVAVDVVLDEVAVPSQMHTKRIDARLSPSESVITESPQWQRVSWDQSVAVHHHRRLVVSESENVIVIVSATETGTMIVLLARVATTIATTTVIEEIGKTNARDCIAAASIEVLMMSSIMETSVHRVLDAAVRMTKMNSLVANHGTPRYERSSIDFDYATWLTNCYRGSRESVLENVRPLVSKNVLVRKPPHLLPRMFTPAAKRVR